MPDLTRVRYAEVHDGDGRVIVAFDGSVPWPEGVVTLRWDADGTFYFVDDDAS